jgi:Isochorismatase family
MKRAAFPPAGSVLLLIDLQNGIGHPSWGTRNNPSAEANIQRLLDRWRTQGWPVWHVRHDSTDPKSPCRPGQQGNEFKPAVAPLVSEPVIPKRTNSAFIGTDLEARGLAVTRPWLCLASSRTIRWKRQCAWPAILNWYLPCCRWLHSPRSHRLEWHPAER